MKRGKFDERRRQGQTPPMPKTPKKTKPAWGGKRAGTGAPEGNQNSAGFGAPEGNRNAKKKPSEKKQTKTISPRLELSVYEALESRAEKSGNSPTKEAEEILRAALSK
jgi:hypothetical protein